MSDDEPSPAQGASADTAERFLIVNADDFGRSAGINRGIIEAHEHGIVTSASLMVRYPSSAAAADYARGHPKLSVGLHFDLAEWEYRDGHWRTIYELVDPRDPEAVRAEFERQNAEFVRLSGGAPAHLDSHQHLHLSEPARTVVLDYSARTGAPVRSCTPAINYCGSFYGQTGRGEPFPAAISVQQLRSIIDRLAGGWTELACHPGYVDDWTSSYSTERERELRVLCSPEIRDAVMASGVQLRSFFDFRM